VVDSNARIPGQMVDSLSAYEFQVQLDDEIVNGVFSVQGLTSFAGEGELPPLLITKMVKRDRDTPFNRWIRETQQAAGGALPTRNVVILAMDEGTETRRWTYQNAHIVRVGYSEFNTALSELVEERITIRAEKVVEDWL
jgi:hypothetical protein